MDFSVFFQPAFSGGGIYLDWVLSGIKWTLWVSILGWLIAFSVGSVLGVLRTSQLAILRAPATVYVEIFRNVPLLVQMFIWYFVLPEIVPRDLGIWLKQGMPLPEFWSAVLCLGFYTASRVAEQVRSGIQSIPRGQTEAGLAMGLTRVHIGRQEKSLRVRLGPGSRQGFPVAQGQQSFGCWISAQLRKRKPRP
jgi:glutamate/aspartate transport system permease protein